MPHSIAAAEAMVVRGAQCASGADAMQEGYWKSIPGMLIGCVTRGLT
jgi:hypothetical protein